MPIAITLALTVLGFNFANADHNLHWFFREVRCLAVTHRKCPAKPAAPATEGKP